MIRWALFRRARVLRLREFGQVRHGFGGVVGVEDDPHAFVGVGRVARHLGHDHLMVVCGSEDVLQALGDAGAHRSEGRLTAPAIEAALGFNIAVRLFDVVPVRVVVALVLRDRTMFAGKRQRRLAPASPLTEEACGHDDRIPMASSGPSDPRFTRSVALGPGDAGPVFELPVCALSDSLRCSRSHSTRRPSHHPARRWCSVGFNLTRQRATGRNESQPCLTGFPWQEPAPKAVLSAPSTSGVTSHSSSAQGYKLNCAPLPSSPA